jgi:DNA-binding HxlR family transcriptional regulator
VQADGADPSHTPADRVPPSSAIRHIDDDACRTFQSSVELVGKRWSSAILMAVARDATRFSDIIASVPGLSDRLLAQRLKELQSVGFLERDVIASIPVQVRYRLTPRGADLLASLQPLVAWGQRWEEPSKPLR